MPQAGSLCTIMRQSMRGRPKATRILPAKQHEALYEVLRAAGWSRRDELADQSADVVFVSVWSPDAGLDARVGWVDDEVTQHFFGLVWGDDRAQAVAALKTTGWMVDGEQAIAAFQHARSVEELCRGALALGVLANGPIDPNVFEVLVGLLRSSKLDVQFDALAAIAISSWPAFEAPLRELAADPTTDEELRDEISVVLDEVQDSSWNEELR